MEEVGKPGPAQPLHTSGRMSFRRSYEHESVAAVIAPERGGIFKVHVSISGANHAADARLLAAAYNALDPAARKLGVKAVALAEARQDGALLVEVLGNAESILCHTPHLDRSAFESVNAILANAKGTAP